MEQPKTTQFFSLSETGPGEQGIQVNDAASSANTLSENNITENPDYFNVFKPRSESALQRRMMAQAAAKQLVAISIEGRQQCMKTPTSLCTFSFGGSDSAVLDGAIRARNKGSMSLRTAKKLRESQIKAIHQLELDSDAVSLLLCKIETAARLQHDHETAVQLWVSASRVADYWTDIENEMVNISHQLETLTRAIMAADDTEFPIRICLRQQFNGDGHEEEFVRISSNSDSPLGDDADACLDARVDNERRRRGIRWGDIPTNNYR